MNKEEKKRKEEFVLDILIRRLNPVLVAMMGQNHTSGKQTPTQKQNQKDFRSGKVSCNEFLWYGTRDEMGWDGNGVHGRRP